MCFTSNSFTINLISPWVNGRWSNKRPWTSPISKKLNDAYNSSWNLSKARKEKDYKVTNHLSFPCSDFLFNYIWRLIPKSSSFRININLKKKFHKKFKPEITEKIINEVQNFYNIFSIHRRMIWNKHHGR